VVLKDVPQGCTVAGVPARIVRLHGRAEFRLDKPARPIHC
jgi:serine acetyltransferase